MKNGLKVRHRHTVVNFIDDSVRMWMFVCVKGVKKLDFFWSNYIVIFWVRT